jgi:hypothetical protein
MRSSPPSKRPATRWRFGLAEAFAHFERALTLWETVPNPAELVQADLAELPAPDRPGH